MSESMVERVARGIWEAEGEANRRRYVIESDKFVACTWAEYDWKDIYRSRAHAAIEAMREPSEEMVAAGIAQVDECTDEWRTRAACVAEHLWPKMIDAALSEGSR